MAAPTSTLGQLFIDMVTYADERIAEATHRAEAKRAAFPLTWNDEARIWRDLVESLREIGPEIADDADRREYVRVISRSTIPLTAAHIIASRACLDAMKPATCEIVGAFIGAITNSISLWAPVGALYLYCRKMVQITTTRLRHEQSEAANKTLRDLEQRMTVRAAGVDDYWLSKLEPYRHDAAMLRVIAMWMFKFGVYIEPMQAPKVAEVAPELSPRRRETVVTAMSKKYLKTALEDMCRKHGVSGFSGLTKYELASKLVDKLSERALDE